MKRWLSWLMVVLLLFSFAACSSGTPSQEASEQEREPSSAVSTDAAEISGSDGGEPQQFLR